MLAGSFVGSGEEEVAGLGIPMNNSSVGGTADAPINRFHPEGGVNEGGVNEGGVNEEGVNE